jgi:hemerythrin-like domain-containing protein
MTNLFQKTAPTFDEPLEMLEACHERIEAKLALLEKLVPHLRQAGCDEQARQAAQSVMRYFDTAGANHHHDEDADLFPMLRAAAGAAGRDEVGAALYELESEHQSMDRQYSRLREQLAAVAAGESARLEPEDVEQFAWIYRRHMGVESSVVFPFAREALSPPQRQALGASMAARRGG